jgi:hypothetical protein
MATLVQMRDAIKKTIKDNLSGVHVYDTVPDIQEVPCVVVIPHSADFHVAFARGSDTWEFDLAVMVSHVDVNAGQDQLDNFVSGSGPKSIREIFFNNDDLGLPDTTSTVKSMKGYGGNFDTAGNNYIGAVLRLSVTTSGTA